MLKAIGNTIEMVEGDWGLALTITINGVTFGEDDILIFTITQNKTEILEKAYTPDENSSISFELTEEESSLLTQGDYKYSIDWYVEDDFFGNLVNGYQFKVRRREN